MLPKRYRIRKNKDFKRIACFGQKKYTQEIILKWLKNNLKSSRYGIVVSLKVAKKATIRNKIKRQISEIIRKNIGFIKPGYDIIFITTPAIKNLSFQKIKNKINYLLNKSHLIKNNDSII